MKFHSSSGISLKQWQTTDKCTLMTHSAPVEEYIDLLVCAVENYVHTHFWPQVKVTFYTVVKLN